MIGTVIGAWLAGLVAKLGAFFGFYQLGKVQAQNKALTDDKEAAVRIAQGHDTFPDSDALLLDELYDGKRPL